jgi:hypothetical protein
MNSVLRNGLLGLLLASTSIGFAQEGLDSLCNVSAPAENTQADPFGTVPTETKSLASIWRPWLLRISIMGRYSDFRALT